MSKKKTVSILLCIAIILMIVSMVGSSLVQSSGGKVNVQTVSWETSLGTKMSGLLLVPKGVSPEAPAPGVVVCHGFYNNKEMQDAYYVELARRGFVVLAIDMMSHGESDNVTDVGGVVMSVNEAVNYIGGISYVDASRIGIEGHSLGSASCNVAAQIDAMFETPRIAAIVFNSADPTYRDEATNTYVNIYGNRSAAIIASQYDEFNFYTTDKTGALHLAPDFIYSDEAQSFLNFGADPEGLAFKEANTIYSENMNGKEAYRAVYTPAIIHAWSHFSAASVYAVIEFFDRSLGSPVSIPASNQIWQYKEALNFLGLIGFALFILSFTLFMVYTPLFADLRREESVYRPMTKEKSVWFWGMTAANVAFAAVTYLPICVGLQSGAYNRVYAAQNTVFAVCAWAAVCGLFALALLCVYTFAYGKKNDVSLREMGVTMNLPVLGKTVLLALISIIVSYAWVYLATALFHVDFRIWVLAARYITADKLLMSLFPYALLLLVYFIPSAIMNTCFGNFREKDGFDWNDVLSAVISALPALILLGIQYSAYIGGGHLAFDSASGRALMLLWLIPLVGILPASVIISRKIYKATKNPYLPAIINAVIVAVMSCANSCTWL